MERASCGCKHVRIVEGIFGQVSSENSGESNSAIGPSEIKSYRMCNNYGMEVIVINWGATIVSIKCLDKYGEPADIVMGFDNIDSYLDPRLSEMMGCIVGRCNGQPKTGDSSDGDSSEQEERRTSATNDQANSCSLGRRVWEAYVEDGCRVVMSCLSPDGEDGYPGDLLATIKFELTRYNSLEIGMRAVSSKPTAVNFSHSSIFNLAGHASGSAELRNHEISLNCDRWIQPADSSTIADPDADATDVIRRVGGTDMDLRMPQLFGQVIDKLDDKGLHHLYLSIARRASLQPKMSFVSRISHPKTGRFLEVYSDQPGVDFYTGGQLPPVPPPPPPPPAITASDEGSGDCTPPPQCSLMTMPAANACEEQPANDSKECLNVADCDCKSQNSSLDTSGSRDDVKPLQFLPGKCGAKYRRFGGFSLLPRNYLTSAKIPLFPSATLRPGQVYYHDLVYKFGIELDTCCI